MEETMMKHKAFCLAICLGASSALAGATHGEAKTDRSQTTAPSKTKEAHRSKAWVDYETCKDKVVKSDRLAYRRNQRSCLKQLRQDIRTRRRQAWADFRTCKDKVDKSDRLAYRRNRRSCLKELKQALTANDYRTIILHEKQSKRCENGHRICKHLKGPIAASGPIRPLVDDGIGNILYDQCMRNLGCHAASAQTTSSSQQEALLDSALRRIFGRFMRTCVPIKGSAHCLEMCEQKAQKDYPHIDATYCRKAFLDLE